ncbi:MAG: hypothetical protein IPH90_07390 [Thermomonas sp.]|nr:hypothetical protein [Thermomonas sp.]
MGGLVVGDVPLLVHAAMGAEHVAMVGRKTTMCSQCWSQARSALQRAGDLLVDRSLHLK